MSSVGSVVHVSSRSDSGVMVLKFAACLPVEDLKGPKTIAEPFYATRLWSIKTAIGMFYDINSTDKQSSIAFRDWFE